MTDTRFRAADDCTKPEASAVPRAALRSHGRRHDLPKRPGVGVRQKGKVNLVKALKELEEDKSTPSARKSSAARARWWVNLKVAHQGRPYPLTVGKLRSAAAVLKQLRYRSAAQYLYAMKKAHW